MRPQAGCVAGMQGSEEGGRKPRIMLLAGGWRGAGPFFETERVKNILHCVSEQHVRQRRVPRRQLDI